MRSETAYQAKLIKKLQDVFPGCYVFKNDPETTQGLPDLLVLFGNTWFMLEVKLSVKSPHQPNQSYYVDMFNDMSFAAFIYPEIEDEVLHAIQFSLGVNR